MSVETPRALSLNLFGLVFICRNNTQILQIGEIFGSAGERLHDRQAFTADHANGPPAKIQVHACLPHGLKHRSDQQRVENEVLLSFMFADTPKTRLLSRTTFEGEGSCHDINTKGLHHQLKTRDILLLNQQIQVEGHPWPPMHPYGEAATHRVFDALVFQRIDNGDKLFAKGH